VNVLTEVDEADEADEEGRSWRIGGTAEAKSGTGLKSGGLKALARA
jgi:hypothetical protein